MPSPETTVTEATSPRNSSTTGRALLRRVLSIIAVVAMLAVGVPKLASVSEIWHSVSAMSWPVIVVLSVVALWNLMSYGLVLVAATPGLTYSQALVATQSSTAVANVVPGGGAAGIGITATMFRAWGFSSGSISLAVVCTGIWNTLMKLGLPLIAVALLLASGDATVGRLVGASVGVGIVLLVAAVLVGLVRSDRFARRVGTTSERMVSRARRLARRSPVTGWSDAASAFRSEALTMLRGCWVRLTFATLISQASLFAVLYVAMRGVGISSGDVNWIEALGAFSFVRLISTVPVSPGGVGVVELGLSGALIAAGAPHGPAVAGVVLFRTLTYVAPIIAGVPAYLVWRRRVSWRVASP